MQVVSLRQGQDQIEFDTFVDWHERQTLLKAHFPMDLNVDTARAEIQFGHVKRATHRNTSWDAARFEACMHRWVDLSEPTFGAAILSDSKYGYHATGTTLGLSLLKGPNYPNPDADLGEHRFTYALRLHDGERDLDQVVRAAERLNNPIRLIGAQEVTQGPAAGEGFSFVMADQPNICVETLKQAEDGDGFVLRLYETANQRCRTVLGFGVDILDIRECDLIERDLGEPIEVDNGRVELTFKPFEIKTLRLRPAND